MKRWFLLAASVWPPVYIVVFVALVAEATIRNAGDPDNDLLLPFEIVVVLHLATIVLLLVAMVVAVIDALRTPRLKENERLLWALLLVLGNVVTLPIYWWMYVRPTAAPPATPSRS